MLYSVKLSLSICFFQKRLPDKTDADTRETVLSPESGTYRSSREDGMLQPAQDVQYDIINLSFLSINAGSLFG